MPVHPESAMMGEERESIARQVGETEDRRLKVWGEVMGRSASSRKYDGGSSSSSSSESEDSDCKTAKGLGRAKLDTAKEGVEILPNTGNTLSGTRLC
jgi:hypothetical protein